MQKTEVLLKYALHPKYKDLAIPPEKVLYEQGDYVELGYDVFAAANVDIHVGETAKVPTGITFDIEPHNVGYFVKDRGSMAATKKITTRAGVVEASFRGQLFIVLRNDNYFDYKLREYINKFDDLISLLNRMFLRMRTYPKFSNYLTFDVTFIADELEELMNIFTSDYKVYNPGVSKNWVEYTAKIEKALDDNPMMGCEAILPDIEILLEELGKARKFIEDRWDAQNTFKVKVGDKIAQLVLVKAYKGEVKEIPYEELSDSPRGKKCLGSSDNLKK